jgi:hypothetical protein
VATRNITPTHGTVLELIQKVEQAGHRIFISNYFTTPKHFNDLHQRKINECGTFCHNRKEMLPNFIPKTTMTEKRTYCVQSTGKSKGCVGRTNEKFMSLLRCTFQPQKVTSRKVGKL